MFDSTLDFTVPETVVERWDREWAKYFLTEDIAPHVVPEHELGERLDIAGLTPQEIYATSIATHPAYERPRPLHIWAPAEALIGKDVIEIGCGTGFLSRQLNSVVRSYLGVDASRLALAVAAGCRGDRCEFLHLNDTAGLARHGGSRDTLVGREFFIHQCFADAVRVMRLAHFALREGGQVYADFFQSTDAVHPEARVFDAHATADPDFPSSGFHYNTADIAELAFETGFRVVATTSQPDLFRTFVTLQVQR